MMCMASLNLIQYEVALRQSSLLTQDLAESSDSAVAECDEENSDLDDV